MSVAAAQRSGTGLEFLGRLVRGETESIPIGELLGFRVVEAEAGRVALAGRPDRRSFNLIGTVHGGWTASILDSALALATLSTLDEKSGFTTLDIRVNFVRPITLESGELRAEGRVLHGGRRVALCEAKLTDAGGRLLAHATGSCLIVPRD